eukprot:TRINITY_DN5382_c0_g1_i3.p1 TRINITY_DN5382_c0_g1~~TRINITY_DN5382_c0_g1_i3.p1  ORF type:complete len:207 (-),score=17.97 TRINITY_DN5382_c0_g1_i3:142-762(-)
MDETDGSFLKDLRETLNSSLQNLGLVAAFMTALAGAIYTSPAEDPKCFGTTALHWQIGLCWCSMGMFFFTICATVLLANDVQGIPDDLLLGHLHRVSHWHALPQWATYIGCFMMAMGYGIDIGERRGCAFSVFGLIAAPCFMLAVVAFGIILRCSRQHTNSLNANGGYRIGQAIFISWYDLLSAQEAKDQRVLLPSSSNHGEFFGI